MLLISYFHYKKNRIFDYPRFAKPLGDEIRSSAEQIAKDYNIKIDFIRKKNFRKEKRIHDIIEKRGNRNGLVHNYSAMEPCLFYKPWHDKIHVKRF